MQPWAKQLLNKSTQHQCSSARIYKNYVHKRYILGGELRINQEEKKEFKHRQSRVHSTGGALRKINADQWKMVTERGRKHSEASTNPSYEQAPHSSLWKQHHQLGTTCSNPRVCETQYTFKPWPTVELTSTLLPGTAVFSWKSRPPQSTRPCNQHRKLQPGENTRLGPRAIAQSFSIGWLLPAILSQT